MAVKDIKKDEFAKMIHGNKPVLVDFWAPWCVYCRRIGPALDRIAAEYCERIDVVKVNIDDHPDLAEQAHIEVIPTLVIYQGGEDLGSVVAPASKAAIGEFLEEYLGK